jgi:UDP-N-acetyl-D-glucosamine dehydrogenase
MKVAVIGLGYVGLPLACLCARKGFSVKGLEKRKEIVESVNKGKSHIKDDVLQKSLMEARPNLIATLEAHDIKDCNVFLICVPTPVNDNKEPDFEPLVSASRVIGKYIKPKDLVVVESTVFPGTCEEYVLPVLNEESRLVAGKDYYFSHCPERVNPGDVFWTVENIPRVVGGFTKECTKVSAEFYQKLLGGPVYKVEDIRKTLRPKIIVEEGDYKINTIPLGSITMMNSLRDAEAVKAMENTVRDVNIAFVNELAKISDALNLDVVDIIDGMETKPFGKGPFYPGIGVGGHCIAVDPEWLKTASIKAGFIPEIIQIARNTNNGMPAFAISQLKIIMKKPLSEVKVCLLGVSYKGNIDDPRESPFYEVKNLLEKQNVKLSIFDPWYTKENTADTLEDALKGTESVIVVTDHTYFREKVTPELLKRNQVRIIIDGRNCLEKKQIEEKGIIYRGIGR